MLNLTRQTMLPPWVGRLVVAGLAGEAVFDVALYLGVLHPIATGLGLVGAGYGLGRLRGAPWFTGIRRHYTGVLRPVLSPAPTRKDPP